MSDDRAHEPSIPPPPDPPASQWDPQPYGASQQDQGDWYSDPEPTGYGPPQHPAFPGQPVWAEPRGESGRRGRGGLALVGVVMLMVLAAVGGGIAGASLYAHQAGGGAANSGTTRVVDAPQLDYTSLASIASQVSPSVVSIRVGDRGGSGVIMSPDGYIVTNAHVVEIARDGQVGVRFSNGDIATATVVGEDRRSDIAVIRVEGADGLTSAEFGDSDDVLVGDSVLAIGSPLGYEGSVTKGIVSALDRTLRPEEPGAPTLAGLLQTDAAINRGNSGGALVNLAGEVVGINTAIAVVQEESGFLGLGFAVPSNRAMAVAEQLIQGNDVQHAFMGVLVADHIEGGALIQELQPGSPAEQAGLADGDVVVRLGDTRITGANDLHAAVQSAAVGDQLEVEFERDGARHTTTVTLGELPGD